ncbi:Sushi repeat-containing protein SRPX2, partial [Geodia barretti]
MPLTQSRRSVCYEQETYQDEEEEPDETFSLRVVVDDTVDPSLMVSNLVVDASRGTTQVRILGDIVGVVECPTLNDPDNGNLNLSGNSLGDTAEYTCNTGYNLMGESISTCGADSQWSGNPPVCELVQCPDLSSPMSG